MIFGKGDYLFNLNVDDIASGAKDVISNMGGFLNFWITFVGTVLAVKGILEFMKNKCGDKCCCGKILDKLLWFFGWMDKLKEKLDNLKEKYKEKYQKQKAEKDQTKKVVLSKCFPKRKAAKHVSNEETSTRSVSTETVPSESE